MAYKFTLVRSSDGAKRPGYFGFSWATLLAGPLTPLARRDFGSCFVLMLSEALICAIVFLFDKSLLMLAARLGIISLSWAILYNELHVLGLVNSGFRFEGPSDVVSALQNKFASTDTASRVRLLRERSLVFVVIGLACLQAATDITQKSSLSFVRKSGSAPGTTASREATPAIRTPTLPQTAPLAGSSQVPPPQMSPPPTAPTAPVPLPVAPKAVEAPRPPTISAAEVLAERERECDAAMGSQFDTDLPSSVKYVADTSAWSEADIDQAIASCDAARVAPGRRYNTQLGRAYAARAVLLAASGNDSDARDTMNKAIAQWNAAEAQGSGAAMNFLGAFYKGTFNSPTFTFVQPDYPKALQYWLKGDSAGNLKATRNAGGMLLLGQADFAGVRQDIKKSRELLEKAIRGGDAPAASLYGQALYYGYPPEIGKKDAAAGLAFLTRACGLGDPSAKSFFDNEIKAKKLLLGNRPAGC
jgi:hypothetical protein